MRKIPTYLRFLMGSNHDKPSGFCTEFPEQGKEFRITFDEVQCERTDGHFNCIVL